MLLVSTLLSFHIVLYTIFTLRCSCFISIKWDLCQCVVSQSVRISSDPNHFWLASCQIRWYLVDCHDLTDRYCILTKCVSTSSKRQCSHINCFQYSCFENYNNIQVAICGFKKSQLAWNSNISETENGHFTSVWTNQVDNSDFKKNFQRVQVGSSLFLFPKKPVDHFHQQTRNKLNQTESHSSARQRVQGTTFLVKIIKS